MRLVVRIVGGITALENYPELENNVGRYLVRYEPEMARLGEQWIWTTDDVSKARVFENTVEFHELYRRDIGTRWDGKKDRPITVFHLQIEQAPEGGADGIDSGAT